MWWPNFSAAIHYPQSRSLRVLGQQPSFVQIELALQLAQQLVTDLPLIAQLNRSPPLHAQSFPRHINEPLVKISRTRSFGALLQAKHLQAVLVVLHQVGKDFSR